MKIAIMQPYFLPYLGYFQLIYAVDQFVVYDQIEYLKQSWINRNRILVNSRDVFISVPLRKDSDYLLISQRMLADSWPKDRTKMLNRIRESYRKAPYFKYTYAVVEAMITTDYKNLFDFLYSSLLTVRDFIGIKTPIIISSSIDVSNSLKGSDKVLAICKACGAEQYINPIGGTELYSKDHFLNEKVKLSFLKMNDIRYMQFSGTFIPALSIIDVLMFNSVSRVRELIQQYTIE